MNDDLTVGPDGKPQPRYTPDQVNRIARLVGGALTGAAQAIQEATRLPGPVCFALLNFANARLILEGLKGEFDPLKTLLADADALTRVLSVASALSGEVLEKLTEDGVAEGIDQIEILTVALERGAFKVADSTLYETDRNTELAGEVGRDR